MNKSEHNISLNDITDDTSTINQKQYFLKNGKAKDYIGVGVGGVLIKSIKMPKGIYKGECKQCVLLYKRYKNPEDGKFSIVGGSGNLFEEIEDTLRNKFSRITGIPTTKISVGNVILVNNHLERNVFHYLSPSYYVNVDDVSLHLYWDEKNNNTSNKREVNIAYSDSQLKEIHKKKTSKEMPLLVWVPIELILNTQLDKYFTYTTFAALRQHNSFQQLKESLIVVGKK